jgi:hypothetical protein
MPRSAEEKSARAAASRIYYREHRRECLARMKAYRDSNKESQVQRSRNYYRVHREEKLSYQRRYQEQHREEISIYRSKSPNCYRTWVHMRNRCLNHRNGAFPRYGARGIKVCDRWSFFSAFLEDMGERPKGYDLHRIDNDGDYEKSNCEWVSKSEHARLTRSTIKAREKT